MAPNFLALATTLENLGARRLLAKKVNFVPWLVAGVAEVAANKHDCSLHRRALKGDCELSQMSIVWDCLLNNSFLYISSQYVAIF